MTKNNQRELQELWAYNKYWVMAKSPKIYNEIRLLFKNNLFNAEIITSFNSLLAEAAEIDPKPEHLRVAYQHVWGYFKKIATAEEKTTYLELMDSISDDPSILLEWLQSLTKKYQINYLMNSRLMKETYEEI